METPERWWFALHVDCCLLVFGCFANVIIVARNEEMGANLLWMEKEGRREVVWKRKHKKEEKRGNPEALEQELSAFWKLSS
jgi:hypothetical protein